MQSTEFVIGTEATCVDGECGHVTRVVVDPLARAVTHLVVEPNHRQGLGRLVPLDLVDATAGSIRLRCTLAAFEALEDAEETRFLAGGGSQLGYDPEQAISWPYYGIGPSMGMGGVGGYAPLVVTSDKVPLGEVMVRRGERVHATDGDIGHVQGLVVDPSDRHVTHVLLKEGHLWGRKDVAIPIGAVVGVTDGIRLRITKQEVGDLPAVDLEDRSSDVAAD